MNIIMVINIVCAAVFLLEFVICPVIGFIARFIRRKFIWGDRHGRI